MIIVAEVMKARTAGADASVEIPKLHNIKLHMINIFALINFTACKLKK